MSKQLTGLAVKYGSDKLYKHNYIPVYEELFKRRTPLRVLEIGIGYPELMQRQVPAGIHWSDGCSLRMWADLWPGARIIGADIRPEVLLNEGNISSFLVDQSDYNDLRKLATEGPFDIIIDDGSHKIAHQYLSASVLIPYLRDSNSLYIIEDVLPSNGRALIELLGRGHLIELGKTWDDNMVVINNA